jgi:hypothetical protein
MEVHISEVFFVAALLCVERDLKMCRTSVQGSLSNVCKVSKPGKREVLDLTATTKRTRKKTVENSGIGTGFTTDKAL